MYHEKLEPVETYQHAIGSYTTVDQMNMKITHGSMRPRSATAPTASATADKCQSGHVVQGWEQKLTDGSEHALIDGEHKIRELGGRDTRRSQHIRIAEVFEVAEKPASGVGEGE
jgi:hypothetical protein